jgi:hypothetical protein
MRSIPKPKNEYGENDFLTIDDKIQKSLPFTENLSTRVDRVGQPVSGILDNVERTVDIKMLNNESEILSLLMKASGQSEHVTPSFYEGGDDVYIANKERVDVTVTDASRRAIHTISNYYNTLGIYRDDFDKTQNDKLARNAYYAICEKAMMDYMRSVQYTVKDSRNGDTIESATDFFNTPNPQDDMGSIFAMLIRDITRYDAGVLVKSFNKGGFCTEIKPYLSTEFWREQDRVPFIVNVPIMNTVDLTGGAYASHQQPTYQGWWSHGYTERFWQRSRTGVYIPFQPEEVCYFMMYPRTDGIYGTDFIKFLKYQIQYLIDSTKAAGKTFENGVVPSVVWEHPEVHTIPQLKQRIVELKYNNQGWQRFGSVIHTVNGEKVSSLAQSLHDMQWLEGQKFVAQLVWATWGFSPEEFMGGGENRASSYVKRNITKSRLLYPLMTFLEQRINREVLPFLKGYRKDWRFSFVRDIELDDEQKVATTNSIKASTFLQYYQSGFPIEASMELSGLDKNKFKFDIDMLEAEIMQNQMMMSGQQPGEMTAGGLEDQEMGRYGPGSEGYVDAGIGDTGQGAAQFDRDPRDPSIDEEQYKKAYNPANDTPLPRAKPKDRLKEYMEGRSDAPPVGSYPGTIGELQKTNCCKPNGRGGYVDVDIRKMGPLLPLAARAATAGRAGAAEGAAGAGSSSAIEAGMGDILSGKLGGKKKEQESEDEGDDGLASGAAKWGVRSLLGKAENKVIPWSQRGYVGDKPEEDQEWQERGYVQKGLLKRALGAVGSSVRKKIEPDEKEPTPSNKVWQSNYKRVAETTEHVGKKIEFGKEPGEKSKVVPVKKKFTPSKPEKTTAERNREQGTAPKGEIQSTIFSSGKHPAGGFESKSPNRVWKSLVIDKKDTRPDQDYDPYWLAQGIQVEMEHTTDPEVAKEIAKDHLDEFDMYYQSLKKMENGLRKAGYKYQNIELYDAGTVVKAKVYITHPSEAPKGRAVRRGNKGGYYYITNERKGAGADKAPSSRQAQKKKSGGKGWGGEAQGESEESEPMMPPSPPDIPQAEEQIKIEGLGVGIVVAIVGGRLVVKKLNNGPTNQFIKIVEKKSGELPNAEKIVKIMVQTAQEMGLEIYE